MRKPAIERFVELLQGELGAEFHREAWSTADARSVRAVVCTFPRSGTTWMLQAVREVVGHAGPGNQGSLCEIIWPDDLLRRSLAFAQQFGLSTAHPLSPEISVSSACSIIKTHSEANHVPQLTVPYFYVARDPVEVLDSSLRFFNSILKTINPDLFSRTGGASPDAWLEHFLDSRFFFGNWCVHVSGWWNRHKAEDVTFTTFRKMKNDPLGLIDAISSKLGHPVRDNDRMSIVERCSFPAMKADPQHRILVRSDGHSQSLIDQGGVEATHVNPTFRAATRAIDDFCRRSLHALGSDFPYDPYIAEPRFAHTA